MSQHFKKRITELERTLEILLADNKRLLASYKEAKAVLQAVMQDIGPDAPPDMDAKILAAQQQAAIAHLRAAGISYLGEK